MEATINSWLKKQGDAIEEEEPLLEVSTDKVDTEIPSSHAGIVKELLVNEGDVVQVGKPIAVISTDGEDEVAEVGNASKPEGSRDKSTAETDKKAAVSKDDISKRNGSQHTRQPEKSQPVGSAKQHEDIPAHSGKTDRFYSPLVRNIAREEQISLEELDQIDGTGKEGRVTKKDILSYVKARTGKPQKAATSGVAAQHKNIVPPPSISARDEIIEMDRMRKIIAERMVNSVQTSAHVQSFIEADVTNIVKWRQANKDEFQRKTGEKLTFTPLFLEAIVKAIKDYPMVNASVDQDKIIKRKDINIGMAVALPSGNLIVPVIKHADQLSITGLSIKVNELARRARENALTPDDLTGGTYSVSNVGVFGSVMGTPIILQPQVAIMALGSIEKKPAVLETIDGDVIAIRHKMFLSHSYDHRIIDGMLGSLFAQRVAYYLEHFDMERRF